MGLWLKRREQKEDPLCLLASCSQDRSTSKQCLLPSWIFCLCVSFPAHRRESDAPVFSEAYLSSVCCGILGSYSSTRLISMWWLGSDPSQHIVEETAPRWVENGPAFVKTTNHKAIREYIYRHLHAHRQNSLEGHFPTEVSSGGWDISPFRSSNAILEKAYLPL